MANTPLVTIVTPSYNQASFLEQTILSVLAQDYPNIEYLVVDGASTDGSVEIIRRYADRLAWWVSEPDNGQAEAINKGMQRARGELVAWLNSDDLYLPGAIRQAVDVLMANPALGMVFGDALTIDAQGRPINRLEFGDWGLEELIRFRIICQPAIFMRREAVEKAGFLDPSYHFMLDHHLWLRIAPVFPIQHIKPSLWAAARFHPAAKNVTLATEVGKEVTRILEWMQGEPSLSAQVSASNRQVLGGADRLTARYLLDGGMPAQALKYYGRALRFWPGYALKHWQRMLYALLCLVKLGRPVDQLRARAVLRQRRQLVDELQQHAFATTIPSPSGHVDGVQPLWPGLRLDH